MVSLAASTTLLFLMLLAASETLAQQVAARLPNAPTTPVSQPQNPFQTVKRPPDLVSLCRQDFRSLRTTNPLVTNSPAATANSTSSSETFHLPKPEMSLGSYKLSLKPSGKGAKLRLILPD